MNPYRELDEITIELNALEALAIQLNSVEPPRGIIINKDAYFYNLGLDAGRDIVYTRTNELQQRKNGLRLQIMDRR